MKQFYLKLKNTNTKIIYMIPIRFAVGLILLHAGIDKITSPEFSVGALRKSIDSWYVFIPWDFYRDFLTAYFFPYIKYFYYFLIGGEIFAGTSILLGFQMRIGSVVGFMLALNYYLMLSWQNSVTAGFYLLLVASTFSLCFVNPSNILGLDSILKKK